MRLMHRAVSSTWIASALFCVACQNPSQKARPWQASDHDHAEAVAPTAETEQPAPVNSSPHARDGSGAARAMQAWITQCVRCHGRVGTGDGPDGAGSGARNLSDPAWQSATSDERIADVIRHGRGMMPAFPLQDDVVNGLVALIRRMAATGDNHAEPEAEKAAPGAP